MKKRITAIMCSLSVALVAAAQAAFVTNDSVAVFYPAGYDASQHEPSPIFERQPVATMPLPASWQLRPSFSVNNGHSVATISVPGDVDFYGTGEVTINANGIANAKEYITVDKIIGRVVSSNGEDLGETDRFRIHYSKNRTHAVPAISKRR